MAKIIGVCLILFGALMLAFQGIRYTTTERVADIGSLHVQREEKKTLPLPPVIGGVTLAGGVFLLASSRRRG